MDGRPHLRLGVDFDFTYLPCWVIWTLGWSMLSSASCPASHLGAIVFGLALIFGHHLVDNIKGEQFGASAGSGISSMIPVTSWSPT